MCNFIHPKRTKLHYVGAFKHVSQPWIKRSKKNRAKNPKSENNLKASNIKRTYTVIQEWKREKPRVEVPFEREKMLRKTN
jgi:hypothetical protein